MVSFKQAFNAARKAGNRYFSWNGNDYNTMTKEEQYSGIGDYFSKFKGNVGNNSNFQKAASNMISQMMGVFQNPTKGKYAGQDYNIGIYFKPQFNSPATNQLIDQATLPPSTQEITSINTPVINNFNRSQVRALMSQKGLDPYAYTGSQRKALRKALNSGQDIEAIFKQWSQDNQPISYNAEGGSLKGTTKEQMVEDFKQWIVQKLQNGELEKSDLEDKQKLEQLFQSFIKEQQGVQTAMNGAKLNYINKLNGKCPQGTHLSYYRIGGTLCKKCEADAYNESSDPIKAFKQKCGGKVKKAVKQKCGGKVKKKELGGEVDNKKNQPKPKLVKKPQNKIIPKKPQNPRPGPKDLKKLPNGKYPKYWTPSQRGEWDSMHPEEAV